QAPPQAPAALLPDDFDPFAPPTAAPVPTAAQPPVNLGSGPGIQGQSLDELFGLGGGSNTSPFAPGHPLAEPIQQANTARSADPRAAWRPGPVQRAKPQPAQRDDAPEVNAALPLPRMVSSTPPQANGGEDLPTVKAPQRPEARPPAPARAQPAQKVATPEQA